MAFTSNTSSLRSGKYDIKNAADDAINVANTVLFDDHGSLFNNSVILNDHYSF